MTQPNLQQNVDLQEVQKFTDLANEWWDKSGAFATLHQINPLRLNWIEQQTIARQQSGLTGNDQYCHDCPEFDKTGCRNVA